MAVLLKGGGLFFHCPKTGGKWVREVLRRARLGAREVGGPDMHGDVARVMYEDCVYQHAFSFAFVRHPVRWLESYWRFTHSGERVSAWGKLNRWEDWHPNAPLAKLTTSSATFDEFARGVCEREPGYVTHLFGRYCAAHVRPSFVGRFERLRGDLSKALADAGEEVPHDLLKRTPPENVSDRVPCEWRPETLARFQDLEAAGLARYGYERIEG